MYTEDDTYDALRRIPLVELERQYEGTLTHLEYMHMHYRAEKEEHDKQEELYNARNKFGWLVGYTRHPIPCITLYTTAYIESLSQLRTSGALDKTGWTVDEYVKVLDDRWDAIKLEKKTNNRKATAVCVVSTIPVCITTVAISKYLSPPIVINLGIDILIGLTAGTLIAKFIKAKGWW